MTTESIKGLVERLKEAKFQCIDCRMEETAVDFDDAISMIEQQAARITALESENRELSEFVIEVGGFWGNSKSKLVGEGSLAEVINRGLREAERYRWIKSKATRGDTGWMYFYHLRTVDIPISQPRA